MMTSAAGNRWRPRVRADRAYEILNEDEARY